MNISGNMRRAIIIAGMMVLALSSGAVRAQITGDDSANPPVDLLDLGRFTDNQQTSEQSDGAITQTPLGPDNDGHGASIKAGETSEQSQTDNSTPNIPASTIGRRSLSSIGLAAVGVRSNAPGSAALTSLIWSDSEAETALKLVNSAPVEGGSPSLNRLTIGLISQASVPPRNAGNIAEELVASRLNWLAKSGQSDILSQIIRYLPDGESWADWKRWQVEYHLIKRDDQSACKNAEDDAQQSLVGFWHKSRIICALLAGQTHNASFSSDILKASGEQDDNFFQLVDKLLGRSSELSLDLENLTPMHLMLMDAAHEQISLAAFESLPSSMAQAASTFRYLTPDTALKTSFMMLDRGGVSAKETEQLWRALSSTTPPISAEAALATLDGPPANGIIAHRHDQLASALLWVSLVNRQADDTDMLISAALDREVRSGRLLLLLDIYASLIRQRIEASQNAQFSNSLKLNYAMILALDAPNEEIPPILALPISPSKDIKALFASLDGQPLQIDILDRLDAWSLLPILEAMKVRLPDHNWVSDLNEDQLGADLRFPLAYYRLSPKGLRALEQAAISGRVAESGLLAASMIQPYDLGWIEPQDGARVMTALTKVGLDSFATSLGVEYIKAHLLRVHFTNVDDYS